MTSINHTNTPRQASTQTQVNTNQNATGGSINFLNRQAAMGNAAVGVAPKFMPALTEEEAVGQARLLKALADPTRLRILSLLSRHEGEVCVFEIVESFTLEQPTISHHLRILRDAGLVDCRKKGLWAYYYVRRDALNRAREIINGLA
ncbi:MAG TPA: metalloregulator ArsR/SmtB family transcription factor [Ktedonobacteraceae bacterium]|nr:metalloregulator ArsR/SmtB family transcription factor [Ktedonobacteraceae bacterium]